MLRDEKFPKRRRVRLRRDFQRVFAGKCSVADTRLIVYIAANGLGESRLGLSVGKRVGGAVARHRVKRLIREAFRVLRSRLPAGVDIICVARPPPATADQYRASLLRLVEIARRKLESRRR